MQNVTQQKLKKQVAKRYAAVAVAVIHALVLMLGAIFAFGRDASAAKALGTVRAMLDITISANTTRRVIPPKRGFATLFFMPCTLLRKRMRQSNIVCAYTARTAV